MHLIQAYKAKLAGDRNVVRTSLKQSQFLIRVLSTVPQSFLVTTIKKAINVALDVFGLVPDFKEINQDIADFVALDKMQSNVDSSVDEYDRLSTANSAPLIRHDNQDGYGNDGGSATSAKSAQANLDMNSDMSFDPVYSVPPEYRDTGGLWQGNRIPQCYPLDAAGVFTGTEMFGNSLLDIYAPEESYNVAQGHYTQQFNTHNAEIDGGEKHMMPKEDNNEEHALNEPAARQHIDL